MHKDGCLNQPLRTEHLTLSHHPLNRMSVREMKQDKNPAMDNDTAASQGAMKDGHNEHNIKTISIVSRQAFDDGLCIES